MNLGKQILITAIAFTAGMLGLSKGIRAEDAINESQAAELGQSFDREVNLPEEMDLAEKIDIFTQLQKEGRVIIRVGKGSQDCPGL